jgi:hypothetical protein
VRRERLWRQRFIFTRSSFDTLTTNGGDESALLD